MRKDPNTTGTGTGGRGFTLVEILIVVTIIGILAAVAIPKFMSSTRDARDSALETDLAMLDKTVEMYYHQHGGNYPGTRRHTDGAPVANAAESEAAFVAQLALYSDAQGRTSNTKDATYKYGPYLKRGIPRNPYNGESGVTCDIVETDITVVTSNPGDGTGWKFYIKTGRIIGNHDPANPKDIKEVIGI